MEDNPDDERAHPAGCQEEEQFAAKLSSRSALPNLFATELTFAEVAALVAFAINPRSQPTPWVVHLNKCEMIMSAKDSI